MNSLDGILKPNIKRLEAMAESTRAKGLASLIDDAFAAGSPAPLFTKAKNDATACENPGCDLEHPKTLSLEEIQAQYDEIEDRVYAERAKDAVVVKNPKWEDKTTNLTKAQQEHLDLIANTFNNKIRTKYPKGQAEHGGNLWDMPALQLLDNAIEENVDQFTYLLTLRQKLVGSDD